MNSGQATKPRWPMIEARQATPVEHLMLLAGDITARMDKDETESKPLDTRRDSLHEVLCNARHALIDCEIDCYRTGRAAGFVPAFPSVSGRPIETAGVACHGADLLAEVIKHLAEGIEGSDYQVTRLGEIRDSLIEEGVLPAEETALCNVHIEAHANHGEVLRSAKMTLGAYAGDLTD